jgi:hypothetical protein
VGGTTGESEGVIGGIEGVFVGDGRGTGDSAVDIEAPSFWRYRFQYLSSS